MKKRTKEENVKLREKRMENGSRKEDILYNKV